MEDDELDKLKELRDLLTPKRKELETIEDNISQIRTKFLLQQSESETKLHTLEASRFAVETDINTIEKIIGSPKIPTDSVQENDVSPFAKRKLHRHTHNEPDQSQQPQRQPQPQPQQQQPLPIPPRQRQPLQQQQYSWEGTPLPLPTSPSSALPTTNTAHATIDKTSTRPPTTNNTTGPSPTNTANTHPTNAIELVDNTPSIPGIPASHSVRGWARSTHFVMSLLWHSKVMIPECSLFDENSAIQDHLFVGQASTASVDEDRRNEQGEGAGHAQDHEIGGVRVLRSTREKTTLSHIFKRLERKATSPLCAVNRAVGSHGQVVSVAGFNLLLDDLRAKLNRPSSSSSLQDFSHHNYLGDYDQDNHGPAEEEECNDFCIQEYIEPLNGVRYEVTCTRKKVEEYNGVDSDILTVDVVPSNYANYYTYPDNYVPSTQYQQRNVVPPTADMRQRMVTSAMSVLQHAEVAHDVKMVHVVLEMIVAINSNPGSLASLRRKRTSNGGGGGGVGVAGAKRVEVFVTGASEVHWVMAPGGWRTLRAAPTVRHGDGPEAHMEADIAFEASGFTDPNGTFNGGKGHHNGTTGVRRSDSAPNLQMSLNVRRQARSGHRSKGSLIPYQPTLHAASGSHLMVRKAFGPTSNKPNELQSSGLLSSLSSKSFEMPATRSSSMARIGDGGAMGKGVLLTNIRVAKEGGHDELHVQMSKELRKAQDREQKQQDKIDLLVAKEEDHLSKIAGLEAAHGRLRKTLKTTESNLETYAMEAKQRIESLQKMLISTQHKLTDAQQDSARERALRIQNAKKLEKAQSDYRVLQIRHDELVSRLALVADIERNGSQHRLTQEKLEHDHAALIVTHEKVMSEAEELRQRLGMAEEEILQQRSLRKTLYMLMGDTRTPGVRPPKRVAGGYSTYARPGKRNVAKAVKLIVDGEIAEAWQNKPKPKKPKPVEGSASHLRSLRALKKSRKALTLQCQTSPGRASVDTPSVVLFLKSMFGKRTLYGKPIKNASGLFKLVDRDNSGDITQEELLDALIRLDSGLNHEQISTLVAAFDDDENGLIDYGEFVDFFKANRM